MDKPRWERGDTMRSVFAIVGLGKVALAELLARFDTKYADAINGEDDND